MNRQQRRAAEREQAKGSPFHRCTRANVARGIAIAEQAGHPAFAELMREMATGTLGLIHVTDRCAIINPDEIARATMPTVAVIGDDDYRTTGPAGWKCAETIAQWARSAVVHAAGATVETYREAIRGARQLGSCALVETDSANAKAWTALFVGKPVLMILPRGGAHPVTPAREALQ